MHSNIDSLPFDVLYVICGSLDINSIFSLAYTCRSLTRILQEPTLCRQVLLDHACFSPEATLTVQEQLCSCDALKALYQRRRRIATGDPAAVFELGNATNFVFGCGTVCWVRDATINVLNLSSALFRCQGLALTSILDPVRASEATDLSLLCFGDDILVFAWVEYATGQNWLGAIDVSSLTSKLLFAPKKLQSTNKLFAKCTKDFVYFGTHSAIGSHGHREWLIRAIAINPGRGFDHQTHAKGKLNHENYAIQLEDFPGSDMGNTVTFAIHDGDFVALSNCTSFDVLEISWTSYYQCIRFPLDNPSDYRHKARIWRREHKEGPINDSWTELLLQTDERTNELLICEARKEWINSGSIQTRTFYVRDLALDQPDPKMPTESGRIGPEGDPLRAVGNCESTYSQREERLPWQEHPERFHTHCGNNQDSSSFILKHTKDRTYRLNCNTFTDIVVDTDCCERKACLQLRTGSRSPKGQNHGFEMDWRMQGEQAGEAKIGADQYNYYPISLWPSTHPSLQPTDHLHTILNLEPQQGKALSANALTVQAKNDDQCLVYLVKESESSAQGKLVCVCYDSTMGVVRPSFARSLVGRHSLDSTGLESACVSKFPRSKKGSCESVRTESTVLQNDFLNLVPQYVSCDELEDDAFWLAAQ